MIKKSLHDLRDILIKWLRSNKKNYDAFNIKK